MPRRPPTAPKNATVNRELAALKRMFSSTIQAGRLSARLHIPMLEENNTRQGFVDHQSFLALREALPDYLKDQWPSCTSPAGASAKCAGLNGATLT